MHHRGGLGKYEENKMELKKYTEESVKNMTLDIAKVIAEYSGLTVDQVGTYFVRCAGRWDTVISIIYIMRKERIEFNQAVHLFKKYVKQSQEKV